MIYLDTLTRSAESTDYDIPIKPETLLKMIDVARAAKAAWALLDVIEPNSRETDELFKALEGIQ